MVCLPKPAALHPDTRHDFNGAPPSYACMFFALAARHLRSAAYPLLVAGFLLGVLHAQAPIERRTPAPTEPPLETLKLSARLVTVAVNAVDNDGKPVSGLEQQDFRLLEDGHAQKISFFEKQSATPLSIVLAVDGSESLLRNERLEKQAATRFVKTLLRPQDELDLMSFSDAVDEVVPFTADKGRIEAGLDHMVKGSATAMYDAVYLASQKLGETSAAGGRRRVLVLITDGGDTVHGTQYPKAVEQAQRAGVIIYALVVVPVMADAGRNTGGEHALIQMTQDTGGKYFYVQDARDLAPAFEQVSEDLRTQYVLGYYAPPPSTRLSANNFRSIKVEITDPDVKHVQLRFRTGYYAGR